MVWASHHLSVISMHPAAIKCIQVKLHQICRQREPGFSNDLGKPDVGFTFKNLWRSQSLSKDECAQVEAFWSSYVCRAEVHEEWSPLHGGCVWESVCAVFSGLGLTALWWKPTCVLSLPLVAWRLAWVEHFRWSPRCKPWVLPCNWQQSLQHMAKIFTFCNCFSGEKYLLKV